MRAKKLHPTAQEFRNHVAEKTKASWILPSDIAVQFRINDNTVNAFVHYNKDNPILIKNGKINLGYLNKFKDEYSRLTNIAHDYYYLINTFFKWSDLELARVLSNDLGRNTNVWTKFIYSDLFSIPENKTILNLTVSVKLIQFVQWGDENLSTIILKGGKHANTRRKTK